MNKARLIQLLTTICINPEVLNICVINYQIKRLGALLRKRTFLTFAKL